MNLKDLIKPPPAEGYIKNSSNLVTALFVLAGILYYPTNGYGAVIALIAALIVLIGQKMLIAQTNKDFTEMQLAEKQFQETQNSENLAYFNLFLFVLSRNAFRKRQKRVREITVCRQNTFKGIMLPNLYLENIL